MGSRPGFGKQRQKGEIVKDAKIKIGYFSGSCRSGALFFRSVQRVSRYYRFSGLCAADGRKCMAEKDGGKVSGAAYVIFAGLVCGGAGSQLGQFY